MTEIVFNCPSCGNQMRVPPARAGAHGKCGRCSDPIVVPLSTSGVPPSNTESTGKPAAPAPPQNRQTQASPSPQNPPPTRRSSRNQTRPGAKSGNTRRLRANRVVAEKPCPICNRQIDLGDLIVECRSCGKHYHETCFDNVLQCPSPQCRVAVHGAPGLSGPASTSGQMATGSHAPATPAPTQSATPPLAVAPPLPVGASVMAATKPCPYCGETILFDAQKCKHCMEFLDDRLRAKHANENKSDDSDLKALDVILCIICSLPACIIGFVYGLQGKKKGWKMVGLAIVFMIFWNFLVLILDEL